MSGRLLLATLALTAVAAPASAQIGLPRAPEIGLPGVRDLPLAGPLAGETLDGAGRTVGGALDRLRNLARAHPRELDIDDLGRAVVRGEVLVADPSPEHLQAAETAGFRVIRDERLEGLDVRVVTLAPPQGLRAARAVQRLRRLAPDAGWDFNHLYVGAASGEHDRGTRLAPSLAPARIGLIDTGVEGSHPALKAMRIERRAFAPGGWTAGPHGTAVASLAGGVGTTLYAADVYGATPRGGSADAVARALGWMAVEDVGVVNVSLVGPRNAVLEAAVKATSARGALIVAAVGNDGPSAPALYPAAYPQAVAVTGVGARRRPLPEAGRGSHVDFAAPGAGSAPAGGKSGAGKVRGTSYAAPLVAARLAALLPRADRTGAERALQTLAADAEDLGAKGPDPLYGSGFVRP
jgi:hypothetical protein